MNWSVKENAENYNSHCKYTQPTHNPSRLNLKDRKVHDGSIKVRSV